MIGGNGDEVDRVKQRSRRVSDQGGVEEFDFDIAKLEFR